MDWECPRGCVAPLGECSRCQIRKDLIEMIEKLKRQIVDRIEVKREGV